MLHTGSKILPTAADRPGTGPRHRSPAAPRRAAPEVPGDRHDGRAPAAGQFTSAAAQAAATRAYSAEALPYRSAAAARVVERAPLQFAVEVT